MKYNVLGFYQPRAVELGLCSDDLLVLRWFVDFAGTPKMRTMIIDNQIYYWVNYSTVLEELPILRISKQTLYKKHFTNLCNANVLTHKQVKDGGNFSYYCYGINYETLVYLQSEEDPSVKNNDLVSKSTKGSVEMYQTLVSKSTEQRLDNNIINLQDNKKENILKEKVNYKQIQDLYNEICISFPKCNILSENRKKSIRARLNTYTVEDFKKVFNMAEQSDFLKGKNNRDWNANFDWIIKDSNFAKILDGNYANSKHEMANKPKREIDIEKEKQYGGLVF